MTGSIHKKGKSYYIVFRVFDSNTGYKKQKEKLKANLPSLWVKFKTGLTKK